MINLPPRQGGDLLLYTLVEPPSKAANPVTKAEESAARIGA
jgi:hypothetical protein